jgi:tetratricopeptide (TPR) repeat protein
MEHTKERLKEKLSESKGQSPSTGTTIQQTNTAANQITTWLTMAESALQAENYGESEVYATRILEVNPTHAHAWYIKGKSAGWQSTLGNMRLQESRTCFTNALQHKPEAERVAFAAELLDELANIARALVQVNANLFTDYPSDADDFQDNVNAVISTVAVFEERISLVAEDMRNDMANSINIAAVAAWNNKIVPDYEGDDDYPSKYQFETLIEQASQCISMIEFAIGLKEPHIDDLMRYDNLITMHEFCCDACSWSLEYGDEGSYYEREFSLTDAAIASRKELVKGYKKKKQQIQK